jgi:hypothetical protein
MLQDQGRHVFPNCLSRECGADRGSIHFGHADHGDFEMSSFDHRLQRRKVFLYARSPMAPKKTSASEWELVINFVSFRQVNGLQIQVGCECGFI